MAVYLYLLIRPRTTTPPRSIYGLTQDSVGWDQSTPSSSQDVSIQQRPSYVPHLFDLVYATDDVRATRQHIPPIFLDAEAVDSSLLLGHGASFTASLLRIPQGPSRVEIPGNLGPGVLITSSQPAPPRPSHVVYKTARVAFDKKGEPLPEHRRAMQSVLTELHALVTPELFEHPNIINFLGYAWGSNPFAPQFRLPALIVEYAEHGTLTQLLRRIPNLDFGWKHLLCLDIAQGLSALHASDLIHGDVKADNVLICRHASRKYVAKISDFGFSIISATESANIWMGGTEPWQAPEVKAGPINLEAAKQTDIYSFGLLVWLVSLNGLNPFSLIGEVEMNGVNAEEVKRTGQLLDIAKEGKWLTCHMRAEYDAKAGRFFEPLATKLSSGKASPDRLRQQLLDQSGFVRDRIVQQLCFKFLQNKLARSLSDLFDSSLHTVPDGRDLDVMIAILESDVDDKSETVPSTETEVVGSEITSTGTVNVQGKASTAGSNPSINATSNTGTPLPSTSSQASWKERGYKHHWFSWQKARELQPSIQNLITNSFVGSKETDHGPGLLMLCAYYMNGYGCKSDEAQALEFLEQSAERGSHIARAFMRRTWSACRPEEKEAGVSYLEDYAKAGSRVALEELRKVISPEQFETVYRWFTDAAAGVGANWLIRSEMLHGYIQAQWIEDGWLMERVRTADKPLSQLIVNKRGDTVLHFTAMCGRWKPFKALILDHNMDVNLQNPLGETPLLAACRSGHGGIVILCLQKYGADSSIAANNGETPLHWLHRYEDQYIEPMIEDLLARGAKIDAATKERMRHSRYPSSVDIEFQMPGTALGWAVHANRPHVVRLLLKHGADPHASPEGAANSPLDMSAYYHHHECLKVIIEHLESKVTQRTTNGDLELRYALMYGPVVAAAEKSADKFSMILRGGVEWLDRLHATFDILREKTKLINFQRKFQGSLLYTAVSRAHDELVDYMLKHDWLVDLINRPIGEAQRTPVLEAVRWARGPMVQKLIEHGADVCAVAPNPFEPEQSDWSALHIFAHEGHDRDLELVGKLVEMGVPVDGTKAAADDDAEKSLPDNINAMSLDHSTTTTTDPCLSPVEPPFTVALRHNAFTLATTLLSLGANPNHLCFSSGLFTSPQPLTPLGHLIMANARYSSARLTYLLNLPSTSFIVEPARRLTALHRCAMAYTGVTRRGEQQKTLVKREEFDMDTNADVMYELLQRWKGREEVDAVCDVDGSTALHLAIRTQNSAGVKALLDAGASTLIPDGGGETVAQLAKRVTDNGGVNAEGQSLIVPLV
ncbi:MAG: hypothetical protein Q9202_005455 [Teloschistes flavicans]